MFGWSVVSMIPAMIEEARAEQEAFMRSLDGLSDAEKQRRIERREDQLEAERRHRELVNAQREAAFAASRNSSGLSIASLIFGAALFGSMSD